METLSEESELITTDKKDKRSLLKRIFKDKTSGVDKGEQGGAQPPTELKDHPCEKMKSEEKLRGGDDYV